jgi:hypothetical protein
MGDVRVVVDPAATRYMLAESDDALDEVLHAIADDARRIVPVDTGALRLSVDVLGIENHVGRVGAGRSEDGTDEYAAVVEGVANKPNPNYPEQPYLRPALYRRRELRDKV